MIRTEIRWAGAVSSAPGGGNPADVLGAPDARVYVVTDTTPSISVRDFRGRPYPGLAELLGAAVAGDVVTPDVLAQTTSSTGAPPRRTRTSRCGTCSTPNAPTTSCSSSTS